MRLLRCVALAIALGSFVVSCSDDNADRPEPSGSSESALSGPAPTAARPPGPSADLSTVLDGGNGAFVGESRAPSLSADRVQEERMASGTATAYQASDLPADGRFTLVPAGSAEYRTRIVIRRPTDPARFNGTVVVEWLNVSGGVDGAPEHTFMEDEFLRQGYAWVGVSAQFIGVEGGPVAVSVPASGGIAGKGLKKLDPARYGTLQHPGDAFSYDIYTQVARALRAGDGLGGLQADRVLAIGESQSAAMLVTYVDGVQPLALQFDGFLIHSRAAPAAPLGAAGVGVDVVEAFFGTSATKIRDDLDVPVLVLEMETDVLVLGAIKARQDDTDRFRFWEVAGAAHADRYILGPVADSLDCGGPVNDGPQQYVARSALRSLDRWVRTGEAPPHAEPLAVEGTPPQGSRDEDGIVLGGIRTPLVDAPVDVLSGQPRPSTNVACFLSGSTDPLPPDRLLARYGTSTEYLDEYTTATDAAIVAGFVVPEDRDRLLAAAQPDRIPG